MQDGTLDTPVDWIPGMKNIRLKDMPSFIRTLDSIMFDFTGSEARDCLKSSGIIFNTFHEFEHEVVIYYLCPKDRGLLVSWCPRLKVLDHPSVHTNCQYACTTWGIRMEVNNDVKRDQVATLVKEMIEGDEGMKLREKALEWKKKAVEASDTGGFILQ
ncbi:UDP-glucuronosyl/UDP-glucosyltransferase [Trema orientale]|uniref:UDP-glucuronosyl/UDP-glucosyltransferase n=1 Tax=Trema orientale TaxID=63057 RepID=A0A2P5EZG2_TREOI|nr:UDP-glucuronosyl/UDP-glucosyltransferase [Trema orientale]